MAPALLPGTIVWSTPWHRKLKRGDVVIVLHDRTEKIKRISKIEANRIFVLGDNPESSTDSRHFGWLSTDAVKARLIWPRPKTNI